EMRESVKIIKQALDKMPYGPTRTYNPKYIPPFRSEIGVSMESLIHHFKLWTEGFTPPAGSVYTSIESPRGELGVFLESDGSPKPYRVHYRTPSIPLISAIPIVSKGHFVADMVAIISGFDLILGDADR
ncbi:MAG TPA: NADH-quinone oxidoreductase subunit D, partial [Anaerolineaceae bacterium]|nr:NADH-quinone oxidoreductase subunit D [Anaerolineaceae bacterium]